MVLVHVGRAYHNTLTGEYPLPEERCGCARDIAEDPATNCEHDECLSPSPEYCQGGYYGCSEKPGMCPLPGASRNGYCHEPYGTHKVCANTSEEVLDWFKSVGNNLSSVVAPGMGWCLCKHWTRGAICCHDGDDGILKGAINFKASDTVDPDVQQIQLYTAGLITKKEFCCDPRFPLAGCQPDICREPVVEVPVETTQPEEPPRVTCDTRENKRAKGGKKKFVGDTKTACDCHDLCNLAEMIGYQFKQPLGGAVTGRCLCLPGNRKGKIRFQNKQYYISGNVA